MIPDTDRLLAESLKLPERDRARLAARLLESLGPRDGTPEELEEAWDEELGRRLDERDEGAPLEAWDSIRSRATAHRKP